MWVSSSSSGVLPPLHPLDFKRWVCHPNAPTKLRAHQTHLGQLQASCPNSPPPSPSSSPPQSTDFWVNYVSGSQRPPSLANLLLSLPLISLCACAGLITMLSSLRPHFTLLIVHLNLQVAGAVHGRTPDMVEALYNMNRVNPSLCVWWVGVCSGLSALDCPSHTTLFQFSTRTRKNAWHEFVFVMLFLVV